MLLRNTSREPVTCRIIKLPKGFQANTSQKSSAGCIQPNWPNLVGLRANVPNTENGQAVTACQRPDIFLKTKDVHLRGGNLETAAFRILLKST